MTTCDRCGYGEPNVHDLTDEERRLAEFFLDEVYTRGGERRSYAPDPVDVILREDPHYFLSQNAIHQARRLLASTALREHDQQLRTEIADAIDARARAILDATTRPVIVLVETTRLLGHIIRDLRRGTTP